MKNPVKVDEFLFDLDDVVVIDFDFEYEYDSERTLAKIWFRHGNDLIVFSDSLKESLKYTNFNAILKHKNIEI
jgi:hypothetical protein